MMFRCRNSTHHPIASAREALVYNRYVSASTVASKRQKPSASCTSRSLDLAAF